MSMERFQSDGRMEKGPARITSQTLRETKKVIDLGGIKYMPPAEVVAADDRLATEIYDREDLGSDQEVVYFPPLHYASLNGYYLEGRGMLYDTENTFHIGRLRDIKQLSLARGVTYPDGDIEFVEGFHHHRYLHSFDALAVATLLANNCGLSKDDFKILQIAALSHDYRTPAGGDTTKKIDPPAFDEDARYGEIFETDEWKEFSAVYNITFEQQELLRKTILGEGVLGKLLDLSDKIAYVSRDLQRYLYQEARLVKGYKGSPGFEKIKDLVEENPDLCSFWDSVEVVGDRVVINDGAKLANFLKVRALLWKFLYENCEGGFSEAILHEYVRRFLYKKGELTSDFLLKVGDTDLATVERDFLGVSWESQFRMKLPYQSQAFFDLKGAHAFAAIYQDDPEKIVVVDNFKIASTPSTKKFLVKDKEGKIVPFNEAFPEEASEIDSTMDAPRKFVVYVVSLKDIGVPPSNYGRVKEAFETD